MHLTWIQMPCYLRGRMITSESLPVPGKVYVELRETLRIILPWTCIGTPNTEMGCGRKVPRTLAGIRDLKIEHWAGKHNIMTKTTIKGHFKTHYLTQAKFRHALLPEQDIVETTGRRSFHGVKEYKSTTSMLKQKVCEILQGRFPKKAERKELFQNHVKHNEEKECLQHSCSCSFRIEYSFTESRSSQVLWFCSSWVPRIGLAHQLPLKFRLHTFQV